MKIKAKDGHMAWVRVEYLHIGKTYAGLLEGLPSKDYNDSKIEELKARAIKLVGWGPFGESGEKIYGIKAHPILIPPTRNPVDISSVEHLPSYIQDDIKKAEKLPSYYIFASLEGPCTDDTSCGGVALVIFFAEQLDASLETMIEEACKDEIWEFMAYNYDV